MKTGAALRHMEQQLHVNDHRVAFNILSALELMLTIFITKATSCLYVKLKHAKTFSTKLKAHLTLCTLKIVIINIKR